MAASPLWIAQIKTHNSDGFSDQGTTVTVGLLKIVASSLHGRPRGHLPLSCRHRNPLQSALGPSVSLASTPTVSSV